MRAFLLTFLALVACGGGDGARPLADAPPPSDGPTIDAAPQPVTLTIARNGQPVAGIHTYFLNPDNSVVATLDTDATGVASKVMPLGGSVTAIDPFPPQVVPTLVGARVVGVNNNELRTFAGVKAGDHLVLTQNDSPVTVNFRLNALANPLATTNAYDVFTSCGSGSIVPGGGAAGSGSPDPGGSLSLTGCNGTVDLVIVARNLGLEGPNVTGVLYKAGVAVTEGGTVTLTDADSYVAPTDRTFSYMNTPDTSITLDHWLVSAHGKINLFSGGVGGSVTVQEPATAGGGSITGTSLQLSQSMHHVVDWGPVAPAYTLDMTDLLLPNITGRQVFDQPGNRVTFSEAAAVAVPDLTITGISVNRVEVRSWHWSIVAPYSAGQVKFPTLPTDVFDWTPQANDGIGTDDVISAKVPGGYDAVRPFALNFDLTQTDGATALVAGTSGRALVVQTAPLLAARARRH